jgi:hypothetical protein
MPSNHSHLSVFGQLNALNSKRTFFCARLQSELSKLPMLIFEENSRDSNSTTFQRLSTTIGRFSATTLSERYTLRGRKDRQSHPCPCFPYVAPSDDAPLSPDSGFRSTAGARNHMREPLNFEPSPILANESN